MTENISMAQWLLFKNDLLQVMENTDTYIQLRKGLRRLIESYEELGYRVESK